MPLIHGDIKPVVSGLVCIGVDRVDPDHDQYDLSTLNPLDRVHLNSGVFHDPQYGQSGVLRFAQSPAAQFEVSVDGGATFVALATAGGTVTSVGVLGDADLTGNVDFATPQSGFMTIQDTGDASPLLWAVDQLGLSGLWDFPTQGFNGRVVNALTDFHGTEVQGVVNVVGASGIYVDIVGQTMTITPGNTLAKCYSEEFGAGAIQWNVSHNLGTELVVVQVYDDSADRELIFPDEIKIIDSNTVRVRWSSLQAGIVHVIGC